MESKPLRHGSLFSGIGGFDLAAEWMGWENVFHCEWNEFGQKVLKYYWPKAKSYNDITKTDFSIHRGTIDILSGGFPCQPYSVAGKQKATADERHLWPEMLRAIREIQPYFVLGENVPGLVSWSGGVVFEQVQTDLETEGYEVTPFLLPACGVNAPHKRERIWFIACKNTNKNGWRSEQREKEPCFREQWNIGSGNNERVCTNNGEFRIIAYAYNQGNGTGFGQIQKENGKVSKRDNNAKFSNTGAGAISYPESKRCEPCKTGAAIIRLQTKEGIYGRGNDGADEYTRSARWKERNISGKPNKKELSSRTANEGWSKWPTQSPICNGDDGVSSQLDGITLPKWITESIKAGGNAIVPQVAHQIFKSIEKYIQLESHVL